MQDTKRRPWIMLGLPALASCAMGNPADTDKIDENLALTAVTHVSEEGHLDFDTTVFGDNPTTLLEGGELHGYEFGGNHGGVVTITMTATSCGEPDTIIDLFGPKDENGDRGIDLVHNDDDDGPDCVLDSKIRGFTLPVDGDYLIVARSFEDNSRGHYTLTLTCDNASCAIPGDRTFKSSRISQVDIDNGAVAADELFAAGDFLFETVFRVQDGMGNALTGPPAGNKPRPNFRSVHQGAFGAPEAQSCLTCHNVGGDDGAGDLGHNIFQLGDGREPATGLPRNPPVVLGLGLRQQIGIEMTNELKAELAAAKAAAAAQGSSVVKQLTAKGVSFGSITVSPDGTVDTANVQGVDGADLVVKPFGWKGREATLRRFVEGGFRVHFGMQSAPSIAKHCATPDPNTFGTGECHDPDGDGVVDEITEGQLSAMAVYMGLLQTPVRVPPATDSARARAAQGEQLFGSKGCASCHVARMKLASPIHVEPADTTGGAGITLNLATDTQSPHPAVNNDGSMTVELWSDFKRHDMGSALADIKPFKNIPPSHFITTPLWGVATSAPYMHDGRSPTLHDAIMAHDGEAQGARAAYAALSPDDQHKVVEFLATLGRQEDIEPPPETVDVSGFTLGQTQSGASFKLPDGTKVPHGGYVIVAREATREQFQQFYGKTLGANVVYINSGATFPQINGSETFSLRNAQGALVEGPTVAQPSTGLKIFQRKSGGASAGSAASWTALSASPQAATPGSGQSSTGNNRIYLSELADTSGTGNYVFEFIEMFVE